MFKQKKFFIMVLVLVVILIGLGLWIGLSLAGSRATASNSTPSGYTAVYLTTGDIYFGKLHSFPALHLSDALVLQRTTAANGQTSLSLVPFTSAFWGPTGDIYLNQSQILFTAPIGSASQVAEAIANPSLLTQQQQAQQQPAQSVPAANSTTTQGH